MGPGWGPLAALTGAVSQRRTCGVDTRAPSQPGLGLSFLISNGPTAQLYQLRPLEITQHPLHTGPRESQNKEPRLQGR